MACQRASVPPCSLVQREGRLLRGTCADGGSAGKREGRTGGRKPSGTRAALHVKTLIGVTCSETSYGRTVLTFHGSHATSNTISRRLHRDLYFIPAKEFGLTNTNIVSLIFSSFFFFSSSSYFELTRVVTIVDLVKNRSSFERKSILLSMEKLRNEQMILRERSMKYLAEVFLRTTGRRRQSWKKVELQIKSRKSSA